MNSASFKLYYYNRCPYCKPICYFVNKTKLAHEAIHLDLSKQEHRTPEYLSINPFGRVPAIVENDGFILFESSTVLRYLVNTRDVPDNWYPKDPKKRSQVDLFFDWFQIGTKGIITYAFSKVPTLAAKFPSIGDPLEGLEKNLGEIENTFLKNRKFLAGDEISLADIQLLFFFSNLEYVNYEFDKFPKVKEWKERVLSTDIQADYKQYTSDSKEYLDKLAKPE